MVTKSNNYDAVIIPHDTLEKKNSSFMDIFAKWVKKVGSMD